MMGKGELEFAIVPWQSRTLLELWQSGWGGGG